VAKALMQANSRQAKGETFNLTSSEVLFYGLLELIFCGSGIATLYFCYSMSGGMAMPGGWTMSMMCMRMPGQTWSEAAAAYLVMWILLLRADADSLCARNDECCGACHCHSSHFPREIVAEASFGRSSLG